MAVAVDTIVKNYENNAKGNNPCSRAKSAVKQAENSIKSLYKRIAEHEEKILNPEEYMHRDPPTPENIQRAIRDWRKQIDGFNDSIDKNNKALKKLRKKVQDACGCWYKPWTWF